MLTEKQGLFLLKLARETIESFVRKKKIKKPSSYDSVFEKKQGVFCTLEENGELRGCIGLPYAVKPLIEAVMEAAMSSTQDPRFPPLAENELKKITIELSVLTEPEEIKERGRDVLKVIEPHKDGLIMKYGYNSGLFLPQVWDELADKEEFLTHLCFKAGLPPDYWLRPDIRLYRFHVQAFKEKQEK